MHRLTSVAILLTATLAALPAAQASNHTWTGGSGGLFGTSANWNSGVGGAPGSGDAVLFSSSTSPCTIGSSVTVASINISVGVTVTQSASQTVTVGGAFTQSSGTFSGGNSQISVGGNLNLSGGTFTSTSGLLKISGAFNKTGGTFTHNAGRVMLASTSDQTFATSSAPFNNLIINDGLVGYWKLDEASGTTIRDSSGYANDGTATSTSWLTSSLASAINFTNSAALSFNGTSSYVTVGTTSLPANNAPQSITAWINLANNTANAYIICLWNSSSSGTSIGINGGALAVWKWGPSNLVTLTPPATGGWHHVAYTFDGTTHNLYLDAGTPSTSTTAPNTLTPNNAQLGAFNSSPSYSGKLDDVRIYNRALSANEINSLYIGNQPGTGLATQTMTGSPTVANDLVLSSGTLSAGSGNLTVSGSWNNYGGGFLAGTGTVTLSSTGTDVVRSAGQPFHNLTLNGSGGTWNLEDWLKVDGALTMTTGALVPGSFAIHASNLNKTSGTFTAGTGTVVIDTTSDVTQGTAFSFNNLRVETPDEANLVGYWKFDEGQGTTIRDSSGTGNDGTLTSTDWTDSVPAGITFDNHTALTFDGSSSSATVGYTSIPDSLSAKSITAWVNLSSTAGTQDIFTLLDSGGVSIVTTFGVKTGSLVAWKGGGVQLAATTAPGTGGWHHVAYTFDGVTHTVYVDGGSTGTGTTTLPAGTYSAAYIGSRAGATELLNGSLDDVRVYNVALSAAQVSNLASGRYAGTGGGATVTLGANSSASGKLAVDSGTLSTSSYTMNASSGSNVVSVGSSGTYTVGSATQTMSGGLTVSDSGTVNMPTAGGTIAIGSGKTLTMDGTLNASSATATIQSVSGTYTFSIGSTAAADPTLNITGLKVQNTNANGMNINVNHSASTTFTRFDNIAFSSGAGTAAGNYNLQIYAPSLYLASNGCTFDGGVPASVANNVKLTGNGTADGETRIVFGNSTCASDKTACEAYDSDDDNNTTPDGAGDTPASNGAVIQWIRSAQADASGSIEGFPTAAFDWSSFTYYSTYVEYHDASGTADRVYARSVAGDVSYYWETPAGVDLIGAPRWDTVGGVHYVYVATTNGKVYRLIDTPGGATLASDTASPWNGTNNPFDCGCTIDTPLAMDTNNIYFSGNIGAAYKLWTVSKTSTTRQPTGSPLATNFTTSNTAPALWTSGTTGHTNAFLGLAGHVEKLDVTAQSGVADNSNPGSSNAVNGRITVLSNVLYAGDDNGYFWSLDPDVNFAASGGTFKNWSYHDATNHASCGGVCQVKSHYVDPVLTRVYYGDQDGHVYVLSAAGAAVTGYPWRPGSSSEAFATAPLYRSGVIVIGATDGFLYVIDQSWNGSAPKLIQTYRFGGTGTAVSGVAYDANSGAYMVSTANATSKDGRLYYLTASTDPTPGFL
ncbi:MAG TPA: LamG domain-containing protein [Polyangia bacterium]|nr:LamG domain-containing protein [Polyangia bacterium]